jgi:hypothetical protein
MSWENVSETGFQSIPICDAVRRELENLQNGTYRIPNGAVNPTQKNHQS